MPQPLVSHSPVVDRLDLGAGMCDALGLSDVSVQAMHHNPARRDLTVGEVETGDAGCIVAA